MCASLPYYSAAFPSRLLRPLLVLVLHVALVSTTSTKRTRVNIDQSRIPVDFFTDVSTASLTVCVIRASENNNELLYNEEENMCRLVNLKPTTFIRGPSTEGWTGWTTEVNSNPCPGPYEMVEGVGCVYLENDNPVTFANVMSVCFMGGKPISPPTNQAFRLLKAYLMSLGPSVFKSYHVGMHPKDGTNLFKWFDGHTIFKNSTIFGPNEPNDNGDCMVVSNVLNYGLHFDLDDVKCIGLFGTVCHIE